jgi:hypothetical protein
MSAQPMQLPVAVTTYQAAHDRHDVDTALTTFTQDAVVHDEDQDWVGRSAATQTVSCRGSTGPRSTRAEARETPEAVTARPVSEVEGYLQ